MPELRQCLLLLVALAQLAIHLRQPVPGDRVFRVQRDRLLQMLLRQRRIPCVTSVAASPTCASSKDG